MPANSSLFRDLLQLSSVFSVHSTLYVLGLLTYKKFLPVAFNIQIVDPIQDIMTSLFTSYLYKGRQSFRDIAEMGMSVFSLTDPPSLFLHLTYTPPPMKIRHLNCLRHCGKSVRSNLSSFGSGQSSNSISFAVWDPFSPSLLLTSFLSSPPSFVAFPYRIVPPLFRVDSALTFI